MTGEGWTAADLMIDAAEVLRMQGYRDPGLASPPVRAILEACRAEGRALLRPRAWHRRVAIAGIEGARVVVGDGPAFTSRALARVLAGSKELVAFVVTIGPALEREVRRRTASGDYPEALMLDAVGSVAVEELAERVRRAVEAGARAIGAGCSNRFAPGYGDWDVREQAALFALLRGANAELAVSLNESCLMNPLKSLSGVIGLGEGVHRIAESPCHLCAKPNCLMRRAPLWRPEPRAETCALHGARPGSW
jgi:hypothetical protein